MNSVGSTWIQFVLCAALISVTGFQLSRCGDAIARRTGLSGSWIGVALLAGAFGVVMLGFTLVSLLMSQVKPSQGTAVAVSATQLGFGLTTPVLFVLYLVAMRTVFAYERDHAALETMEPDAALPALRTAVIRFALAACIVAGAGIWLPFVAADLANAMAWNKSFVGSLFVARATSLPELAVTLAALRIGALDIAIGNLLGSNLFNVMIIAVDDLFYGPGMLLATVSPVHAVTAGSAITMTGLAMAGLFFKPGGRVLRALSWISLGMMAMYLLNTYVLYLHGE